MQLILLYKLYPTNASLNDGVQRIKENQSVRTILMIRKKITYVTSTYKTVLMSSLLYKLYPTTAGLNDGGNDSKTIKVAGHSL